MPTTGHWPIPRWQFTNTGFASGSPEVDTANYAYERNNLRMRAAVVLYELTGQPAYRTFVETNYTNVHGIAWYWWNPYETAVQDALLHFSTLPGVTRSVASKIRSFKQSGIDGGDYLQAWTAGKDAYRAYCPDDQYHWGGNQVKSHTGLLFAHQLTYGLNPAQASACRSAAAGYLHYLHGVNPLSMAYLSNMYDYGADYCANEMYHCWFAHGTKYDSALTSSSGPAAGPAAAKSLQGLEHLLAGKLLEDHRAGHLLPGCLRLPALALCAPAHLFGLDHRQRPGRRQGKSAAVYISTAQYLRSDEPVSDRAVPPPAGRHQSDLRTSKL